MTTTAGTDAERQQAIEKALTNAQHGLPDTAPADADSVVTTPSQVPAPAASPIGTVEEKAAPEAPSAAPSPKKSMSVVIDSEGKVSVADNAQALSPEDTDDEDVEADTEEAQDESLVETETPPIETAETKPVEEIFPDDRKLNKAVIFDKETKPARGVDRERRKNIELALQAAAYDYQTDDRWPNYYSLLYSVSDKVKKKGFLGGVYGSYTWRSNDVVRSFKDVLRQSPMPNFVRVEAEVSTGRISYDSYATGKLDDFVAWEIDGRVLTGYEFLMPDNSSTMTPYVGVGYRQHWDKAGGYVDYFVYDYAEFPVKTSMYYIPIGVETTRHLSDDLDLTLKLEGDILFYGKTQYMLSEIDGSFSGYDVNTDEELTLDPKNAESLLNGGYGCQTSAKIIKKLDTVNLFAEPFFKFWFLKKSDPVEAHSHATNGQDYVSVYDDEEAGYPLYKPLWDEENYTFMGGIRLGVQF